MVALYEYRTAGRRPLAIAGFLTMLTVVLVAARGGAGPVLWSAWAIVTASLAWHLLGHPVAGCRIGAGQIVTFVDRRRRAIPMAEIECATLTARRRGCCACTLTLRTGRTLRLPCACLPPAVTLTKALRRNGVKVKIDRPDRR